MKITEVRYHIVNVPYLQPETWAFGRTDGATSAIVEVEADTGLVGYGELPGMPNIAVAVEALQKTIPLAVGRDPSNIKQFLRATWIDGWHHFPYTGNVATAALEMAMWDLVGKIRRAAAISFLRRAAVRQRPLLLHTDHGSETRHGSP